MKEKTTIESLVSLLADYSNRAQFASFVYTTKEKKNKAGVVVDGGEIARHTLILGANYHKTVEDSLLAAQLLNLDDLKGITAQHDFPISLLWEAKAAVIASLEKTLAAHKVGQQNSDYTKKGLYIPLGNGVNINRNDNSIQLFGLSHTKVVLKNGVHRHVESAAETIAKNLIRKTLPIGKFREFALDLGNVHTVKLDGQTLVIDDLSAVAGRYNELGERVKALTPATPNYENTVEGHLAEKN